MATRDAGNGVTWRKWSIGFGVGFTWDQVGPDPDAVGGWPRIEVGNERCWTGNGTLGWIELPANWDAEIAILIVRESDTIRRLTPAEVERAERGEGPASQRSAADMTTAEIRRELGFRGNALDDLERGGGLSSPASPRQAELIAELGRHAERDERPGGRAVSAGEFEPESMHDAHGPRCAGDTCEMPPSLCRRYRAAVEPAPSAAALSGLTPEQAARYLDATTATLRRLITEASVEVCEAQIAYSCAQIAYGCADETKDATLAAWLLAFEICRELQIHLGSWVGYGLAPQRHESTRIGVEEAYHRVSDALAGAGTP